MALTAESHDRIALALLRQAASLSAAHSIHTRYVMVDGDPFFWVRTR